MPRPRILLTGATGLLGRALLPELERQGDVVAPGLDALDLERPSTVVAAVQDARPEIIVHLAADTRVDRCEEHPRDAFRVNTEGTIHLAHAARIHGARMIYLSTDYVFDGAQREPYREHEATNPLSVYGKSKREAERALLAILPDRLVIRSSSLFGAGGVNFVDTILKLGRSGAPLRVVEDQIQSPTFAGHLAPAVACAALSRAQGVLHLSGGGSCTWIEFARAILAAAGVDRTCEPIPAEAFGRPAPRPAYSVLDGSLAASLLGLRLPPWQEGLAAYLKGSE
jgi:dTDP-4-dehydrorhamnose reductase